MDAAELVAEFDLDRVTHAAAGFDRDKLDWLNGEWIRRLALDDLVGADRARWRASASVTTSTRTSVAAAVAHRAGACGHAGADRRPDGVPLRRRRRTSRSRPSRGTKVVGTDRIGEILDAVIAHVETCDWTVEALALQPVTEALGIKFRKVAPRGVRGGRGGPPRACPLFDSMLLLGRDRTLAPLRAAAPRPADAERLA